MTERDLTSCGGRTVSQLLDHTPSTAFRHLSTRKDVVNQCLEFAAGHYHPAYVFIHFSAAFCTAHCALDLAKDHAPQKCPLLFIIIVC